jgi:hypothetical protein
MLSGTIEVDPGFTTFTVKPNISTIFNPGHIVRFYYHSEADDSTTGLSDPAVFIGPDLQLAEVDIYNLGGQVVQVTGCTGAMQGLTITGPSVLIEDTVNNYVAIAAYPNACNEDVTTLCTWDPASGGTMTNGTFTTDQGSAGAAPIISCNYNAFPATFSASIITALNAECWGPDLVDNTPDDANYYWEPGFSRCWVLGDTNQNCDTACTTKLATVTICDNITQWNDDNPNCSICEDLIGLPAGQCTQNDTSKSPFLLGANFCRYRGGSPGSCSVLPGVNEKRICACIE